MVPCVENPETGRSHMKVGVKSWHARTIVCEVGCIPCEVSLETGALGKDSPYTPYLVPLWGTGV